MPLKVVSFKIDPYMWDKFVEKCGGKGNVSKVLRKLVKLYLDGVIRF